MSIIKRYLGIIGWKNPSVSHPIITYPKMMTLVMLNQAFLKTSLAPFIKLDLNYIQTAKPISN